MIVTGVSEAELGTFSAVLIEAARWLDDTGRSLWRADRLTPGALLESYQLDELRLGRVDGNPAAVMVLQRHDPFFWPEAPAGEALYVHKLAVRRAYAGRGLARAMIDHAVAEARQLDRPFVRLDTHAGRAPLRSLYAGYGFRLVDEREVRGFHAARYELGVASRA